MRKVTVSFDVEVPDDVDNDQVLGVMGQLIEAGLADATSTVEDDEGDVEYATIATRLEIGPATIYYPNLSEFTIGRVVYPTVDSVVQCPGHVDGFALNSVNEVIVVVRYPKVASTQGLRLKPGDLYNYREVHPKFLQFQPVS